MPDPEANFGSHLASAARDAWQSATSAIDGLVALVNPPMDTNSTMDRFVRAPLERGAAAVRWSPHSPLGALAVVPLPAPRLEDPRMLFTTLTLARVLYSEMEEHQQRTASSSGGAASQLPLPPVTLALSLAAVWRYFNPVMVRKVCLSPYCVVERREVDRLFSSCITHLDAAHLMGNLAALIPDAADLERSSGPAAFAADVGALTAMSSGLFVGWAVLQKEVFGKSGTYYAVGALGLSSLAFALQVVRGEAQRGRTSLLLGIVPIPAQFTWAAQLALTVASVPESSFAGHMCGVLAGIAHVYMVRPVLRFLLGASSNPRPNVQPTPRFYGSGTLSGRPVSSRSGSGASGEMRRQLMGALTQLSLAAASVALYVVASGRVRARGGTTGDWRLRLGS